MLTIKEAAKYADKSESWIRKKILSGELEAEKKAFKYGKRWETKKENIDDLLKQAKIDQEVIEVREVNKPVPADDIINRILEATEEQNQALIDEAVNDISDKIEQQNEQNKALADKVENQSEKLDQQNELIKNLSDQVEKLNQRQNKTLFDKIKNFFK